MPATPSTPSPVPPFPQRGRRPSGNTVALVVGAVLAVVGGIPFIACVVLVLSSWLGPAARDPHGYTLIFGTLFAAICALPLLIGLLIFVPAVIRRRKDRNDRLTP